MPQGKVRRVIGQLLYHCHCEMLTNLFFINPVMYANMRLIINMIHALENFDCEKLAKYIRCVFQAILPLDCGLALELADQAHQIAQQSREVGSSQDIESRSHGMN